MESSVNIRDRPALLAHKAPSLAKHTKYSMLSKHSTVARHMSWQAVITRPHGRHHISTTGPQYHRTVSDQLEQGKKEKGKREKKAVGVFVSPYQLMSLCNEG